MIAMLIGNLSEGLQSNAEVLEPAPPEGRGVVSNNFPGRGQSALVKPATSAIASRAAATVARDVRNSGSILRIANRGSAVRVDRELPSTLTLISSSFPYPTPRVRSLNIDGRFLDAIEHAPGLDTGSGESRSPRLRNDGYCLGRQAAGLVTAMLDVR